MHCIQGVTRVYLVISITFQYRSFLCVHTCDIRSFINSPCYLALPCFNDLLMVINHRTENMICGMFLYGYVLMVIYNRMFIGKFCDVMEVNLSKHNIMQSRIMAYYIYHYGCITVEHFLKRFLQNFKKS